MFARISRYIGSFAFEIFVRAGLDAICRFQRFGVRRSGAWVFRGPSPFLEACGEARTRIEEEDCNLLETSTGRCTVIYSPRQQFSFPLWRYGGIGDSFLAWGSEGVVAQWVYLHYHSLSRNKGRWFLSVAENSVAEDRIARAKTRVWLTVRHFPFELCDAFEIASVSGFEEQKAAF